MAGNKKFTPLETGCRRQPPDAVDISSLTGLIWFFGLMKKSFSRRRSRLFLTLFALSIAGCVLSVFLSLYYDISIKMNKELRAYGANIILYPRDKDKNPYINESETENIIRTLDKARLIGYVPYLFTVGEVRSEKVVLVGSWFDQIKTVNPYWNIRGEWIKERSDYNSTLVGYEVAQKLRLEVGQTIKVSDALTSQSADLVIKGIVKTGGQEEYQIFANLSFVQELSERKEEVNIVYVSMTGRTKELEQIIRNIDTEDSAVSANLIRRISQSEGLIIVKIKSLLFLVSVVTLFSTLICVGATMTAMALERRKEIGLKKALGAGNKNILVEFLIEAVFLGISGGILGYIIGFILVQLIGRSVFDSTISFRPMVIPATLAISVIVSTLAGFWPIKMALDMEPAVVLKGE